MYLTSNGAASVVSRDPGEGYRGGGCFGHCEARLVRWNWRKENRALKKIQEA